MNVLEAKKSRGIPDYEIMPSERRGGQHGWTTKGRNITLSRVRRHDRGRNHNLCGSRSARDGSTNLNRSRSGAVLFGFYLEGKGEADGITKGDKVTERERQDD